MTQEEALFEYCLRLGDDSLVLGHRISEWCGHGPVLEEDIALTNMALDLVGQSRTLLTYAGEVEGKGRTEDDLAYLRLVTQYRNVLLCEQPNGDYGNTIMRQFLFDAYHLPFSEALTQSSDSTLAGYANRTVKEARYHLRHSADWVIRLGDGTEESHNRIAASLEELWMFSGELFESDEVDQMLVDAGIGVDLSKIKAEWNHTVDAVLKEATLTRPADGWMQTGGRKGRHSEHMGYLLAELQYMQRAYPGATW